MESHGGALVLKLEGLGWYRVWREKNRISTANGKEDSAAMNRQLKIVFLVADLSGP